MWIEWVILLLCCLYFYLIYVGKLVKAKKIQYEEEKPAVEANRASQIPVIGYGTLLKIGLGMVTVNRNLASYEWAQMYSKVHGAVHAFRFPHRREMIVNSIDMELCKKVMTCPRWANRFPHCHYMFTSTFNKAIGILFGNGSRWKEARRLTFKLLHQLDFFKATKMETFIVPEIAEIVELLGEKVDAVSKIESNGCHYFSPHQMFEVGTLNVVCQVIIERRFHHSDPRVIYILNEMNKANREFSAAYTILEFFPWLKHLPRLTFLGSTQRFSNLLYDFFRDVLKERRANGSYKDAPLDFVDGFLLEIEKQAKSEDSVGLTDEDLLVVLRDMVAAGADTTNSALEHGILHVALQPHIQKRVQTEIDHVTGNSRLPSYDDRQRMVYTQAVLLEILRIASPVPATVRCNAYEDMVVENTALPKGTMFVVNVFGIHRSNKIWEDGEAFRPERFLNDKEELMNTEKIMPFGYGKRLCIGESVAKVTLFIFFTTLLQSFSFEISDAHPPPSFKNLLGLSRCPLPYHVKCRRRRKIDVQ